MIIHPLYLTLFLSIYWLLLGISGAVLLWCGFKKLSNIFLLSTLGSFFLLIISAEGLVSAPAVVEISLGIPDYPLHFLRDPVSAFFMFILSTATIGIGLFSCRYYKHCSTRAQSVLCFHYHFALASMIWIFLAADAYTFLLAWEFVALASYFLIVAFNPTPETLRAGFLYFLLSHLGAFALLASFALLSQGAGDFTFATMHNSELPFGYALGACILALVGFATKAGIIPLHMLPRAHAVAPSPVLALMSGVMLKTAIYGIIRVLFDVLPYPIPNTGLILLIIGLCSALLGVILAAMQTDMKRLLAYSSIENIGIIVSGIGLALLFYEQQQVVWAALALTAALFHCFNHAIFKSLLFLGTGSVLNATSERNMGKLGGLITLMPWVAGFTLIGTLALAGVPPLNGFVSEWLLLQAYLFFPQLNAPHLTMLIPIAAAAFALTLGLSVYVMVKFYGIIFLGKPRETSLTNAKDAGFWECCAMGWLAIICIVIGLFPAFLLERINHVTFSLINTPISFKSSWLYIKPVERISYSPILIMIIMGIICLLIYCLVAVIYQKKTRQSPAWDCGFAVQNARMQDTAEGFGQPIKRIFSFLLHVRRHMPNAFDKAPFYRVEVEDRFWYALYLPILRGVLFCAQKIEKIQTGKINYYLLCNFITLIVLLWWVG